MTFASVLLIHCSDSLSNENSCCSLRFIHLIICCSLQSHSTLVTRKCYYLFNYSPLALGTSSSVLWSCHPVEHCSQSREIVNASMHYAAYNPGICLFDISCPNFLLLLVLLCCRILASIRLTLCPSQPYSAFSQTLTSAANRQHPKHSLFTAASADAARLVLVLSSSPPVAVPLLMMRLQSMMASLVRPTNMC